MRYKRTTSSQEDACYLHFLRRNNQTLIIGSGLATAGLGQFIFSLVPATNLSDQELQIVTIWQSLSFGIGLVLASPVNGLVYRELLLNKSNIEASHFSSVFYSIFRIAVVALACVSCVSLAATPQLLSGNLAVWMLLCSSLVVQVVAAAQRAIFSAMGKWWRFNFQFSIEGLGRVAATVVGLALVPHSIALLLGLNVCVQLLSVVLPGIGLRWIPARPEQVGSSLGVARQFLPLVLSALAVQSFLSLTPALARIFTSASSVQVAGIGGMMQLIRLPVTFSVPITLPFVNQIATYLVDQNFDDVASLRRQVSVRLALIWAAYAVVLVGFWAVHPVNNLVYSTHIDSRLMCSIGAIGVVAPLAIFHNSVQLLAHRDKRIALAWSIGLGLYVVVLALVGETIQGAASAILVGNLVVLRLLSTSVRSASPNQR